MMERAQEICRKLRPVMGQRIDKLWRVYLAGDADGRAELEQTLELLAAKHLGQDYRPDRSPFPPPEKKFAGAGDVRVGTVTFGNRDFYPFLLRSDRLKEHLLIAGRSGSGKTNLAFVLMQGIMSRGIRVLAIDWKRGYRDLLNARSDLRVYTPGRDVAPFRFNPLIPPPGCEPNVWIKLIVDVIAGAYLGGEGVISLLVSGLDHLYSGMGVLDRAQQRWPTIQDLLAWLRGVRLRGRAAMWQASAERILLAMTYGEFGAVVNTQDSSHIRELLQHNVILEMDGLSSNSDRKMFSEALTLWLYRYRLAQGPRQELTNLIVLEEAHNLLLRKAMEGRESVLENSIRMIRQYGMGYVFVDQSASLLSKVAFANSYATIALSQKLRSDIQAISGAMNLSDEQREALSTLPVGTAVIRLADEHPEPFLVKIPRFRIREGSVSDEAVRCRMSTYSGESLSGRPPSADARDVPQLPFSDKKDNANKKDDYPHPPSPEESVTKLQEVPSSHDPRPEPPREPLSREAIRFLADVAARPLSATVPRYQRLRLSRRRGNAVRMQLLSAGLIRAIPLATRSGQVVLYELTDPGRSFCRSHNIDPGPAPRESLEHRYWACRAARHFRDKGYDVFLEHPIKGNGAIDLLAEKPGQRIAVEIETGKSDIQANLEKVRRAAFDRVVLVATSPAASVACMRAADEIGEGSPRVEVATWLDVS